MSDDERKVSMALKGLNFEPIGPYYLGPRTFLRIDDDRGEFVAYVGGRTQAEAERRARLFMQALVDSDTNAAP